MTDTSSIPVKVRWYTAEEGGRRAGPPPGPKYTPTGRFADQALDEMFSVILIMPESVPGNRSLRTVGELSPGFPENVPDFAERFARGDTFLLHEGRNVVAECALASAGGD